MNYRKGSSVVIGFLLGFLMGMFTGSIWFWTLVGLIGGVVVEVARKRG
jgi:hypothetical protein